MIRSLYHCVIRLHPQSLRRQFGLEMLWIYDESDEAGGADPFFADGLASLARQWLIREGAWKVALAAIGGLLHISLVLGGLSTVLPR